MHENTSTLEKIIPVSSHAELNQVVDARGLHAALKVKRDFSNWLKQRLHETDAFPNRDYCMVDESPNLATGIPEYNNRQINYAVTTDLAKHIAMLERTDIGRQIRQYFIEAEKKSRTSAFDMSDPVSVLTYALEQAKAAKAAQVALETATPKALAFDSLMDSSSLYSMAEVAKLLHTKQRPMGQVRLLTFLRDAGVLMSSKREWNQAYQEYIDAGRFQPKTNTYKIKHSNGSTEICSGITTFVTAKGIEFIRGLLEKEQAA